MKHILSANHRELLRQLSWAEVLLAFDFDGTLAPIVPEPGDAHLRPSTRKLLTRLCECYPCAVISGRARDDLAQRLEGIPLHEIVAHHGLDPRTPPTALAVTVTRWRPALEALEAEHPGLKVEDKQFSIAVHYRKSREKKRALAALRQVIAGLGPLRAIHGHQVVNLLPPGAPNKGTALEALRARMGCDTALYIGDDKTDEDVFELDQPGRLLSIRVGRSSESAAPFYVEDQRQVDDLMEALLAERARSSPSPRARG